MAAGAVQGCLGTPARLVRVWALDLLWDIRDLREELQVFMSFPSSGGWCGLLPPGQRSGDVLQHGGGICPAWKGSQGLVCFCN